MTALPDIPQIVLREEDHTYWLGDEQIPSVTTVIADVGLVDYEWSTRFAMERGSQVHKAIHYYLDGDLDLDTLHPMYRGYVDAALRAIEELELEVVGIEQRLFHPIYRYAGTADLIARRHGVLNVVDWKTAFNPPRATAHQVAAYAEAWRDLTGDDVGERGCIGLSSDGQYRLHQYDGATDFDGFLAALSIYNLRTQYGVRKD